MAPPNGNTCRNIIFVVLVLSLAKQSSPYFSFFNHLLCSKCFLFLRKPQKLATICSIFCCTLQGESQTIRRIRFGPFGHAPFTPQASQPPCHCVTVVQFHTSPTNQPIYFITHKSFRLSHIQTHRYKSLSLSVMHILSRAQTHTGLLQISLYLFLTQTQYLPV